MKRLIRAATTAVVVAGYGVVASPANATGASGCPWPYVCFYTMAGFYKGTPVAMYKDITARWQYLGTGRGGYVNPTWPLADGQKWTHLARAQRHERASLTVRAGERRECPPRQMQSW